MNHLYYGDCLDIMQKMPLGSVDLIYLDPPFNSNRNYNAIYKDETGRPLPDQIEAFCDTWTLDKETERAIQQMPVLMREAGLDDEVAEFWRLWMNALRKTNPRLLAYLTYMVQRLLLMHGLLKPTGSLYLHCDPTASHYIKVMLDAVFGHENFRNEIIWHYDGPQRPSRWNFGSKHDTILRYSKTDKYFSDPDGIAPFRALPEDELKKYKCLPNGQYYYTTPRGDYTDRSIARLEQEGRIERTRNGKVRVRHFLPTDEFNMVGRKKQLHDVWSDIVSLGHAGGRERMGYATQKPVALLERIITASSKSSDTIFDPFCGCATTLEAAHNLDRRWIGIDIAIHAVKRVAKVRLEDRLRLVEGTHFTVEGVPRNLEGARDLWRRDKYHFQRWAVEQVDGFVTTRRGSDGGIDGRLYFARPGFPELRSMVIEVKGGVNVGIGVVRDLRGVLEREDADMAGLIVMDSLRPRQAANFNREMASAGDLDVMGVQYPRMQILTAEEILNGKRFVTPSVAARGSGQPALPLVG